MAVQKKFRSGSKNHVRLEQRLLLLGWMHSLFGYEQNRELLADAKKIKEGFNSPDGIHSYLYHLLLSRGDKVSISQYDLSRYDNNIRDHVRLMNTNRFEPITLRYFQHLSVLYTEVYLDKYFNQRGELRQALNKFVANLNATSRVYQHISTVFTEDDLNKLAYWMATGSGKTLIMHINYRQFLHYCNMPLDNIILITPNEGLSEQHLNDFSLSNIPCCSFGLDGRGLFSDSKNTVQVIEITKLVEEKRGGGASVPVEAFEGNNLIFVDEGHKGSGGETWRSFRDSLGGMGFTFEYSATFGQALTAAKNEQLTEEYGKSILFDYSYRYFHRDGFGKDFHILNMKDETTVQNTEMLLLGNLLSFYEQLKIYEENIELFRPYSIDKPLWVFVGSTVNAVYIDQKEKRSDVLTVARFLHHVLQNKHGWVLEWVDNLIQGNSGLKTPEGKDAFDGKFEFLRVNGLSPEKLYEDILAKVFHAPGGGSLHLCSIRGNAGEIGLKASGADDYFGLIYIGDTGRFRNLVQDDSSGIVLEEDVIAGSLFDSVNNPDTTIDVLVGAKKFMEGWNSWRVSNMGLLNIGLKAGSGIIQLFGRGVRLRGMDFSLKRSAALSGSHPQNIGYLETLNIFSLRANYMMKFRKFLEDEGIDTTYKVEMPLRIKPNKEFLDRGLVLPRLPETSNFLDEKSFLLKPKKNSFIRVDLSYKIQALKSSGNKLISSEAVAGQKRYISSDMLDLVDWERIYLELLQYKQVKGYTNIAIFSDTPRKILERPESENIYHLFADELVTNPKSFADTQKVLHETIVTILKKYIDKYFRVRKEKWESSQMTYQQLSEDDSIFQDYTVQVTPAETGRITEIQKLIEENGEMNFWKERQLRIIHFDRLLYQPLLVASDDDIQSTPPSLNESERKFVDDLRQFWQSEKDNSLAGKEIFVSRNLSHGEGISFFDKRGFYPDFILWVKDSRSQRIVFVEVHGMMHEEPYENNDKARLHEILPRLSKTISARTNLENIFLDSFIISVTPYSTMQQKLGYQEWNIQKFSEKHILFFDSIEGYNYISELFAPVN